MSDAHKCDRCGKLYEPEIGAVALDVNVQTDDEGVFTGWSDIDLCKPCGKLVLVVIASALIDLDQKFLA